MGALMDDDSAQYLAYQLELEQQYYETFFLKQDINEEIQHESNSRDSK